MQNDYINTTVSVVPMRRPLERKGVFHGVFRIVLLFILMFVIGMAVGIGLLIKTSTWNGKEAFSFLVVFEGEKEDSVQKSLAIVTLQPNSSSVNVLELPDDLKIETIYGYGQYASSSLYGLMKLEQRPLSFLAKTMTFQFGIPIEHVVYIKGEKRELDESALQSLFQSQITLKELSTLPYLDRVRGYMFLSSVRKDKISRLDLQSSGFEQNGNLDIMKCDQFVSQMLPDPKIREEQLTIAVVNTTQEAKLGARIGRMLFNMGMNVIRVTDSKEGIEKSELVYSYDDHKNFLATQLMKKVFSIQKGEMFRDSSITEEYRADVVFLVGDDVASLFHTTQ